MQVQQVTIGELRPGPFVHHSGRFVEKYGNMPSEFVIILQEGDTVGEAIDEARKLVAWDLATKD